MMSSSHTDKDVLVEEILFDYRCWVGRQPPFLTPLLSLPAELFKMIMLSIQDAVEWVNDLWQIIEESSKRPWTLPPLRAFGIGYRMLSMLMGLVTLPFRLLLRTFSTISLFPIHHGIKICETILPSFLMPKIRRRFALLASFLSPVIRRFAHLATFIGVALLAPFPLKEVFFWGGGLRVFNILHVRFGYFFYSLKDYKEECVKHRKFWKRFFRKHKKSLGNLLSILLTEMIMTWCNLRISYPQSFYCASFLYSKITELLSIRLLFWGSALCTYFFGMPSLATTLPWGSIAAVVLPSISAMVVGVPIVAWGAGVMLSAIRGVAPFNQDAYERLHSAFTQACFFSKNNKRHAPHERTCSSRKVRHIEGKLLGARKGKYLLFSRKKGAMRTATYLQGGTPKILKRKMLPSRKPVSKMILKIMHHNAALRRKCKEPLRIC